MRKTFKEGEWQIDFMPLSNGGLFIEIGKVGTDESNFIKIDKDMLNELAVFLISNLKPDE